MITEKNLKDCLEALHYSKAINGDVYIKEYTAFDCQIKVDFSNRIIVYPEDKGLKVHRKTTCNFSENENFVVLECITSLMDKGYRPKNIELEKPMPGGHYDTGGYCDIQVKDNDGKTFLLIECKKADEFDKYWKKTLADGDQLFRYFNSYRQARALCLYTSDYIDGAIKRTTNIISMEDNEDYLLSNRNLKSFKQVQEDNGDKDDYFYVWRDTYQQDYSTQGIFEDDIAVFTVGKNKYTVDDLCVIDNEPTLQKKYHEFATILRQHNVGSHENAFDKLVNLFLAKIVDETINPRDLQFHWNGAATDDYYSLQDRLQKLYKEGMEKYLDEEVTYIDQHEVSDAFHLFKNDPDATKEKILEYFRQLKFYTNNDFAFLDVHNKELFFHNAVILKKMVRMLEDIKLKTEAKHQFLGDLFEGYLDDGVKQNEGQFLTPLPIVKFLVSSLPLEQIIKDNDYIPKAIDYACGAGHFLTEYASYIKTFVEKHKNIPVSEYYANTYGIEKEYRLSKVSKVSAFMYGQDDIQIIYGDALANNPRIKDGIYSILIANPPYSVKGFLEMLTEEERNNYTLTKKVSDIAKNNSIETFFVERAKQLLKGNGVAAVILPDSILANGNIYVACRELILKYFDIIAIAEMGKGTFGKTGTNTATMFLRRKTSNPDMAEHFKNRVDAWFKNDSTKNVVFEDESSIVDYCEHCQIDSSQYIDWLKGGNYPDAGIFTEYQNKVKSSARYKRIDKKVVTSRYTMDDKQKELNTCINFYIKEIEKEKLYYYLIARSNPVNVIVVKSPTDTTIKEFLGYYWSDAKEDKGIKYLGVTNVCQEDNIITSDSGIKNIKTPLFDPNNYNNSLKINSIIRDNFNGTQQGIPEEIASFVKSYSLVNMLDFSQNRFDKAIKTSGILMPEQALEGKYPVKKISDLAEISRGASPRPIDNYITTGDGVNWIKIGDVEPNEKYIVETKQRITGEGAKQSKRVNIGDFIVSNSMSIGRPYILKIDGCIHDGWLLLSNISENLDKDYFYYILSSEISQKQLFDNAKGGTVKNLNISRMSSVLVPVPPISIQKEIVTDCEAVREASINIKNSINNHSKEIEMLFNNLDTSLSPNRCKLNDLFDLVSFKIPAKTLATETYITTDNMLQKCAGVKEYIGSLPDVNVTAFKEEDLLLSNIRPYLQKLWLATFSGGCSNDVLVLRVKDRTNYNPKFYANYLKRKAFFDYIMQDTSGVKMPRGNKAHIMRYPVPIVNTNEQDEVVSKITALETQIKEAQQKLESLKGKTEEILRRYLQ